MLNFNQELIEKAKQAKSVDGLLAIAKENSIEITQEEAKTYFDQLNPSTGELSDQELDSVSGGACYKDGYLVTTAMDFCSNWVCQCGGRERACWNGRTIVCTSCKRPSQCSWCSFVKTSGIRFLCNKPGGKKRKIF